MKLRSVLFLLAAVVLICSAVQAQVVKVTLDDTINPISEEYVQRAIDHAAQTHADAVLIEIQTPGGLGESMRGIIETILASPVPVIVYVAPSGSRAASAGFFILESADIAAMAPGTNTGAAHPVLLGQSMDDVMKSKLENDAAAFMRSFVSKRGRNVDVAESAVRQSKSFSEQEALKDNLIDYVAKDEQDLFRQIAAKPVTRFSGDKVTLNLAGKPVLPFDMSLRQRVLNFLMDPNMAFLLLLIGAAGIYFELSTPGAVLPGAVGLLAAVLALFALNLLPIRFAALGLIILAFALFALEAKFQTHGVLTISGAIAMIFGALLLVDGPIPEMRIRPLIAITVTIPFAAITAFLMTIAIRAHRRKVQTGQQGLIGEVGVARSALSPSGKVFVHGEIWNATSTTPVVPGDAVRVRAVDGLRLEVEPVGATEPATTAR